MTPELTRLLAVFAAVIAVVGAVVYWWIQRPAAVERDDDAPLPLFGGLQPGEAPPPAGPLGKVAGRSPEGLPPVVPFRAPRTPPEAMPVIKTVPSRLAPMDAPSASPPPAPPRASAAPPRAHRESRKSPKPNEPPKAPPVIREFSTAPAASPSVPPPVAPPPPTAVDGSAPLAASAVVNAAGVPGTMIEGHGLRFSVPAEGTLQFLPGRFEIGSGLDAGREIRFVHVPGPNGMEVTFGRSEGELYRHIQLRDKTVSRQHARMQLREGTWHLVNLSKTNPVAYNGTELAHDRECPLTDGDRIEMGEVVFTFRSR